MNLRKMLVLMNLGTSLKFFSMFSSRISMAKIGDQGWHEEIVKLLEKKGVRILRFFLRCLTRPSLRHEKHRSFLFRRLDLLNRTDPGEEVRNAGYNFMRHTVICTRGSCREQEFELACSGPQLLLSHSLTIHLTEKSLPFRSSGRERQRGLRRG